MTVRVNKQPFNIREKLSELERPIGIKGHELMGAETAQEARDLVSAGRKNMIINGDMRIAQRGTNAVSTNALFPIDRWTFSNTDAAGVQVQQSTDVPAGEGFINSIKWSVNSTSNTTGSQSIRQNIEIQNASALGWGTSKGKSATLSFWVKGSHNGTITSSVREGGSASRSFINLTEVTTSWVKHSFTIPHISDGSWNTDPKSKGISVIFAFDRHSSANGSTENTWISANWINHSNQTEWVTISGAQIYITGVQLEVGKNATEFEHRSIGEELALCQRYYEENKNSGSQYTATGYHTSYIRSGMQFQVIKRAAPTVTITNASNSAGSSLSLSIGNASTMGFNYSMNSAGTSYGVRFDYTADAELY